MKIGRLTARTFGSKTRTEAVSSAVSTIDWDPAVEGTLVLNVSASCVVYLNITSSTTPYSTKLVVLNSGAYGHCSLRWPSGTVFSNSHFQQPCNLARTQTTFDLNWDWIGGGVLQVSNRSVTSAGFIGDLWGGDLAEYNIPNCFETWVPLTETPNDATGGISCDFLVHSKINGALSSSPTGSWHGVSSTRDWVASYDEGQLWNPGTVDTSGTVTGLACSLGGTRLVAILDGTQARSFTGSTWSDFGNAISSAPDGIYWAGDTSTGKWLATIPSSTQVAHIPLTGGTWSYASMWPTSATTVKLSVDYTQQRVMAISNLGTMRASSDWGVTWATVPLSGLTETPVDIAWIPAHGRWVVVGDGDGIFFPTDDAFGASISTWTKIGELPAGSSFRPKSLYALEDTVYCFDDSTSGIRLWYSVDSGANWMTHRLNTLPNNYNVMAGSPFTRRFMWMRGDAAISNEAYLSADSRRLIMASQ